MRLQALDVLALGKVLRNRATGEPKSERVVGRGFAFSVSSSIRTLNRCQRSLSPLAAYGANSCKAQATRSISSSSSSG